MNNSSELVKIQIIYCLDETRLSSNPVYNISTRRYISNVRQLRKCYKYHKDDMYDINRYIINLNYSDKDMLVNLVKSEKISIQNKCICIPLDKDLIHLLPASHTSEFTKFNEDLTKEIMRSHMYGRSPFRKSKLSPQSLHVILNELSTMSNDINNTHVEYCIMALVQNKHIDINPVIRHFNIYEKMQDELKTNNHAWYQMLHAIIIHKSTNINEYLKYICEYPRIFLSSPNLTNEIFGIIVAEWKRNITAMRDFGIKNANIYKTLPLDTLIKYFEIDPYLVYKYKGYDQPEEKIQDKFKRLYTNWYLFPQYRDKFCKYDKHDNYNNKRYVSFIMSRCQISRELIESISEHHIPRYPHLYKNLTMTVEFVESIMQENPFQLPYWYLNYNIHIKDVVRIINKYKKFIRRFRLYSRKDLPINLLLELIDKPNHKICKNIYVTTEILLKYGITPNISYLKFNLMHLDPLYIKQPLCSIDI